MAKADTSHDVNKITRFYGLSTDAKPTNPMVGATFYETDTRHEFVFDGVTFQREKQIVVEQAGALGAGGTITEVGEIKVQASRDTEIILEELLQQQKITNALLGSINDEPFDENDIPVEVR